MRGLIAAGIIVAALACAGVATADPLRYGAADDWPKFHPCGDVWWQTADDVGLKSLRMTLQWPGGTSIPFEAGIQAAVDCALLHDVQPILAVFPAKPGLIGSRSRAQAAFARFVALVGQAFPGVTSFVIGNEPNVNRFWQPQFVHGKDAAGRDYEHTLAQAYDALKVVRPDATVLGPAVSSRGNDHARARSNPSHSPVWFIKDMGDAYRASGRTRRIFDEFDMHPYPPVQDTAPYSRSFQWPQAGAANLDRIKQALWDAFHGTAQPTPTGQPVGKSSQAAALSRTASQALPIDLDEVGSQTVVTGHVAAYTDAPESIVPITEAQQARYYTQLMKMAACDSAVKSLLFFPVIDEADLRSGFESGLLFADLTPKLSYDAVKTEIALSGGECQDPVAGAARPWSPTRRVVGARVKFGEPAARAWLRVTAAETATFSAGLFKVAGPRGVSSASLARGLGPFSARAATGEPVGGTLRAYAKRLVAFKQGRALAPGYYVYAIRLTAVMNPHRATTLVSTTFKVGRRTGRH